METDKDREVPVKKESLMDGLEFFVACGPAFMWRRDERPKQGVVYGSSVKFLSHTHSKAWTEVEAQNYPCA